MSTIEERVARGAAWLDSELPGWVAEIDLNRLVLSSPCRCICGQLYGEYADRPDAIWHTDAEHGFNVFSDDPSEWGALEDEWRRVITERRAAA